jgi:hypothetical protein
MVSLMPGKSEHERQVEGRAVITAFIFKQHLFSIDELSVMEPGVNIGTCNIDLYQYDARLWQLSLCKSQEAG